MREIEITQNELNLALAMVASIPEGMIVGYPYARGDEVRALYYKVRGEAFSVPEGEHYTVKVK